MDSNAIFAILLLIAGIGILTAEVFIPSGGLLGVVTFVTLTISILFAYKAWGASQPVVFWGFCGVLLLMIPIALGGAFYVLPRTALGQRVLLEAPSAESLTPFSKEAERLEKLVGRFGKTVTPLVPGGMVFMDGERLHVISEGTVVPAGQSVEVLEVRGTRLLVRPGEPPASNDPFVVEAGSARPIDFDLPQG
jgi:membrane-bound ClpP family serine protease